VLEFHSPHINVPGMDPFVEGYLRAPGCSEGLWIDIVALQVEDLPDWYRFARSDRWCFDRGAIGVPAPALTPALVQEAVRRSWHNWRNGVVDRPGAQPTIAMAGVEWEWPEDVGGRILSEERVRALDRSLLG